MSGATAYITLWYDQTGNGNHATPKSNTYLTIYDTVKKRVDFSPNSTLAAASVTGAYFTLPDAAFPYGSGNYSFIYKVGTLAPSRVEIFYSAGEYGSFAPIGNRSYTVGINWSGNKGILDSWYSNNYFTATNVYSDNCIVTTTYNTLDGSVRKYYINNNTNTVTMSGGGTGARNTSGIRNNLGSSYEADGQYGQYMYSGQYGFFYWASITMPDADRIVLQNTPAFY